MKLLWFTWKDRQHPLAGGAETVNEELAARLIADGHEVIFLVGGFRGARPEEVRHGFKIIRLGSRWSVYWQAYKYYNKNLVGWADLVIDEVNTMPFFCKFFVKEKNIILAYQLCRQIWFYETIFPLNLIGYLFEPLYLWLLRDRTVLTESESTKNDLQKYGFKKEKIFVFPVGLEQPPLSEEEFKVQVKENKPTLLYFGSLRSMKRPDQVLKAYELAKVEIPDLCFQVAGGGSGRYVHNFLRQLEISRFKDDIKYYGCVSTGQKRELMGRAHLIAVTSTKEGWGLVITEANSVGTPAVVYNVDGLRDSVKHNKTGWICERNTPENLSENILNLLKDKEKYQNLRLKAWEWSKEINFSKSYQEFIKNLS